MYSPPPPRFSIINCPLILRGLGNQFLHYFPAIFRFQILATRVDEKLESRALRIVLRRGYYNYSVRIRIVLYAGPNSVHETRDNNIILCIDPTVSGQNVDVDICLDVLTHLTRYFRLRNIPSPGRFAAFVSIVCRHLQLFFGETLKKKKTQ